MDWTKQESPIVSKLIPLLINGHEIKLNKFTCYFKCDPVSIF